MRLFAGFGRRHVLIALGFCIVVQLAHTGYMLMAKDELSLVPMAAWTVMYFFLFLIGLGCAVAAENLLGPSARSMVLAMVAAALATTLGVEVLLYVLPQPVALALEGKERAVGFVSDFHRIAFRFTVAGGWSLLLIALYAMLQASRRATEELHAVRMAALAAERRVLESDLRAMQGRVDPELLFDSLLEVDRAYERDVRAGQDALDALIRFLRAALPGDAAASATVAGEQELAEAYLALFSGNASPKVAISVTPEARALPMPAMLLLPLVRWALDDRTATQLEIRARRRDAALEVSVRSDSRGAAPSTDAHIAGVRERLARLFAGHAKLDVSVSTDARQVRLEIPAS
jgi:hypothetical protein